MPWCWRGTRASTAGEKSIIVQLFEQSTVSGSSAVRDGRVAVTAKARHALQVVQFVSSRPRFAPGSPRRHLGTLRQPAGRTRPVVATPSAAIVVIGCRVPAEHALRIPPQQRVHHIDRVDLVLHSCSGRLRGHSHSPVDTDHFISQRVAAVRTTDTKLTDGAGQAVGHGVRLRAKTVPGGPLPGRPAVRNRSVGSPEPPAPPGHNGL